MREDLSRLLADLDAGRSLSDVGEAAHKLLGLDRDDQETYVEPFAGIVSEKPAALRRDGQPKQKPGRKPKADTSTSDDSAKTPVDEAKNAADLRVLKDVLTAWGPCPLSVLLHRSGLDADTIGAHVRAAAVIESYDGEYALEGGKLMPSIMIRLISQRPATARIDPAS